MKCPHPGCRRKTAHTHHAPERSTESTRTLAFVVTVPFYGGNEAADKVHLNLARALHHGLIPGCHSAPATMSKLGTTFKAQGPLVTLDPKGDDMGHHPDHPHPLVSKESE